MKKRISYLLFAASLPALLLLSLSRLPGYARPGAAPGDVIISEVGWGGTAASGFDEWIELYNTTDSVLNLSGWTLDDGGDVNIFLTGTIPADGFFLLERTGDETISDIPADQIYTGGLDNSGESLTLKDDGAVTIDTANGDGGSWPAGSGSPAYLSMERTSPTATDADGNWISNDQITRNGLDANGEAINGTPRQPNSPWDVPPPAGEADLVLHKDGPPTAEAGGTIGYQLRLSNTGTVTATAVTLTDTLPAGLTYAGDDSGFPLSQPGPGTLVWAAGAIPTTTQISFHLTATISSSVSGPVTNSALVTTQVTETNTSDNAASATTTILNDDAPVVRIDAVLYDGYETGDADEAVQLRNMGGATAHLDGWQLSDGNSVATFPAGVTLPAGATLWLANQATAFQRQFGFPPDVVLSNWPGFANTGDEVILGDDEGTVVDAVVYEDGDTGQSGWMGAAVAPYQVPGVFAAEGQILYRRRDQTSGRPVPDTNTAADWAQTRADVIDGRKVRYPGWDLDRYFFPAQVTETATLTVAIAPDNAYAAIENALDAAQSSIQIETHTFENVAIAEALTDAAQRGVDVTVLLEGAPAGGLTDQEKYVCQQLDAAGGTCWFMISDDEADIGDRYRFLHAKFTVIDGSRALISSENMSPNSLPNDDKSDGTWGRRGVVLITNASGVVAHLQDVFAHDLDPATHVDLFPWTAGHPDYGEPAPGFIPITATGGSTYTVRYATPARFSGSFALSLVQAPENALRDQDGLLGLVNRAGAGDTILVQQLSERPYWGASNSNPVDDPNPRLEAYLAAARRGARVRLLLDAYFDDDDSPTSNAATCAYVNGIAQTEGLTLECAVGNPAGLGIHNKMVLVELDGRGWVHAGSLNGTEQANKGNREVALQVQSDGAYALLAEMFSYDWPYQVLLPTVMQNYIGPAGHVLISEVLYDPYGTDDGEFIELVNPTPTAIDLSHWSVGDAVDPADFEDVRRFPAGTILPSQATLVIATSATAFEDGFGTLPHFEIVDTDPAVPDLIDDPAWGDPAALLQLGNQGDEVLLRDPAGGIVDAITYGNGALPGIIACPLVSATNHSLERHPFWRDTDDCSYDFRDWPFPNPGTLP